MSTWLTISSADVESYLVAAPALLAAAMSGTDSALTTLIPDVVSEVRGEIGARKFLLSATANSVPPELRAATIYLIIAALQARVPDQELPKVLQDQIKAAMDRLERLRKGDFAITQADDPAATAFASNAMEIASETTRQLTRHKTRGL